MLKFEPLVELSNEIQVACLPPQSFDIPKRRYLNTTVYAVGWGVWNLTDFSSPNLLQNVELTAYDGFVYCDNWRLVEEMNPNWDILVCAGDLTGSKRTCFDDGGGALYEYNQSDNKYTAVAIFSFLFDNCTNPDFPPYLYFFFNL